MSFRRRRLCDFRRVFDRSGCCAASCRKYANPAKVLRIVRKIAISESSAFAHVAQSSCSTYHCAHANACVFTMLSACSKNHRKSMKNRRKIDEKSSKIDPRSSKLALRNVLAGPGKLSEPPRWSPNAPRCAQDSPTCVQVGPTRPNLNPKLHFQVLGRPPRLGLGRSRALD